MKKRLQGFPGDPRAAPAAVLPSSRQPAGLPRVARLKVTDVTGFTIPEINL
jgi:hypothetical protein